MTDDLKNPPVRFQPLRPPTRRSLIAGLVLGPILWFVALVVAAWVFEYSSAIGVGLLVVFASFLVSLAVLSVLRAKRVREENRFADRG